MKLKGHDISLILIVILTATGSFGLGRLSVVEQYKNREEIAIIVPELGPLAINESQYNFLSSKNGTKYYPKDCKGANRIKDENKLYFVTMEEAEEAGYEQSSTCSF